MRAKLWFVAIAVAVLCGYGAALAQSYFIQTNARINLRSWYSTNSRIIETVPSGTALQVVGKFNRWLKINRNGSEVWMADWVPYTRLQAGPGNPPEQQPSQPDEIDNLCFTVRTCRTDEEWVAGYFAFQEQRGSNVPAVVNQNPVSAPSGEAAVVVNVVDGDTIDVLLNGQRIRVRYIGINTPERGEACYTEATNHNRALVQGKTVTLVRDTSDTDRYGRLLRYVYAGGVFVNLSLVQAGYAEAKYYAPDGRHRQTFEAAQQAAPQRGCTTAPASPSSQPQSQVTYVRNCTHARELGIAPVHRGHPAYRRALDRDNDGIGCETSAPASPSPQPAEIDNLCFTVRTCRTDEEWAAGYYAFHGLQPSDSTRSQSQPQSQVTYVRNCTHARELGIAPVYSGHPAYRRALDRDNDGIGCE